MELWLRPELPSGQWSQTTIGIFKNNARHQKIRGSMKLFFILGCPRSGTTLLQAMLNRHPQIAIPPETKLFCDFHSRSQRRRRECLSRLGQDLDVPINNEDVHIELDKLLPRIMSRFVQRCGRSEVRFVGEKTPEHTSRIPSIKACFPKSLIIVLVRDGVCVADSLTRVPWLSCDHGSAGLVWRYYMNHVSKAIEVDARGIHVVRYEELTTNPAEILLGIVERLGADRSHLGEMLKPNANLDCQLFPYRESLWKANAVQPVTPRHRSALSLTDNQAKAIEVACGEMLRRWDYPSVANNVRWDEQFYLTVWNHFNGLQTIARMPVDKWTDEFKRFVASSLRHQVLRTSKESCDKGIADYCNGRTK
jgi:hypothetical protein